MSKNEGTYYYRNSSAHTQIQGHVGNVSQGRFQIAQCFCCHEDT